VKIPAVVFRVIKSFILVGGYQHFGGPYGHYPPSALKIEAKALSFV
jgi:hypothetical protein